MHRPVVCQLAKATPHGPTSAHISVVILLLVMLTTTSTTSVHTKSCPTCHQHVCEISASMSTPTQPWRLVSPEPCLHVLPFYARSVVSVAWCPSRFYSRWSFHWYWDTSTMAVQHWLDYLAISSTSYSRWCQYMTYMFGMQVRTHHAAALSATADWVLVFRCLHGTAPQYLACELYSVANNDSWWRLRSASMSALDVPLTCCVIIGDRAFGVAGPCMWNSFPHDIITSPSLTCFKQRLITLLFQCAFHCNIWLCDTDIFFTVKCSWSFFWLTAL